MNDGNGPADAGTVVPPAYLPGGDGLDIHPFHELVRRLRHPERGCPWDKSRVLADMGQPLLEEAREAAEALSGDDPGSQSEELGDVFLNLMLATVIAEESGLFSWREVVAGITAKLIRRHPHVFGDRRADSPEEALRLFREAKEKEKRGKEG
ncbi:MAG: nucleotide pyrophosphohydrolase [Planctomycetota bacterium]|jgi:uncharacterized protein YabN with tetrapyrrole methylase and pyrophosphatase domain|nr:nucleotide pyrophosphohydrolase [Planctomycetota bacterium]